MKILRAFLAVLVAIVSMQARAEPATVYFNGDILTMEGNSPRYVQAVVVTGDRISFAGTMPEALAAAGPGPIMRDLEGHTLPPGFIDSWGHFALVCSRPTRRPSSGSTAMATAASRWRE
jgi:predicted amidohydrolase YtcJ